MSGHGDGHTNGGSGTRARQPRNPRGRYEAHGLHTLKNAVQTLFKVSVTSVNTLIMRGKDRRMGRGYAKGQNWKKAIVTLKDGDSIDFFADAAEGT